MKNNREEIYHRELDTILKFSALINSSLNIEDVLNHAMKWSEEFTDAEASSIYELDDDRNELFIRIARGEKKEPVKGIRIKVGEGIAGLVVQTGKPVVIQDINREKRFIDKFDRLTGFKTNSMICVPLILRNKAIGALQVLNKKSEEVFSRADLDLLTGMAQQITIAMENAKLYQRLEEKFKLTEQELKKTQEKLIRSERLTAMGHLVQGVAHEIRNPIMTIGGFAHRIKTRYGEDETLKRYTDIILDETNRLETLVKEVHEFADLQSSELSLGSVVDVIDETLKKIEPMAHKQHIRIITDIDEDIPGIKMDPSQLVTALYNIMENGLESMPDGGTLELRVKCNTGSMRIAIIDSGCGISREELDNIYDPFVTSKTRGAGLGLTMVYQVVMNHNGEIKIKSREGKGTIVTIQIPLTVET